MPAEIPRYYVVVRSDLSVAQQIIQVAHCCLTAGSKFELPEYHHLVLLSIDEVLQFEDLAFRLAMAEVGYELFFEPDLPGYTALCSESITDPEKHKLFRGLPLWRG